MKMKNLIHILSDHAEDAPYSPLNPQDIRDTLTHASESEARAINLIFTLIFDLSLQEALDIHRAYETPIQTEKEGLLSDAIANLNRYPTKTYIYEQDYTNDMDNAQVGEGEV